MDEDANRLFESFKLYFPTSANNTYSYSTTSDPYELVVTLNDGSKFLYDDFSNSIRNLPIDSDNMNEDEFKREFGFRLKKIMNRRNITQEELSEMTGISRIMISHYFNQKCLPSFYNVDKIAKALGCSINELTYI